MYYLLDHLDNIHPLEGSGSQDVLFVPSKNLSFHTFSLPSKDPKIIQKALPNLLASELLDAPENNHFIFKITQEGILALVVNKKLLSHWFGLIKDAKNDAIQKIVPDFFLVPYEKKGDGKLWSILLTKDFGWLRQSEFSALCLPRAFFFEVLEKELMDFSLEEKEGLQIYTDEEDIPSFLLPFKKPFPKTLQPFGDFCALDLTSGSEHEFSKWEQFQKKNQKLFSLIPFGKSSWLYAHSFLFGSLGLAFLSIFFWLLPSILLTFNAKKQSESLVSILEQQNQNTFPRINKDAQHEASITNILSKVYARQERNQNSAWGVFDNISPALFQACENSCYPEKISLRKNELTFTLKSSERLEKTFNALKLLIEFPYEIKEEGYSPLYRLTFKETNLKSENYRYEITIKKNKPLQKKLKKAESNKKESKKNPKASTPKS